MTDVETICAMMDLNANCENKLSKNLLQCRKGAAKIEKKLVTPTLADVMNLKDKHIDPLSY